MFKKRSNQEEIMDDLHCEGEVVSQTLRELEIINKWLGGNDVTLSAIDKCFDRFNDQRPGRPLKIADLGCGGGDILKLIAKKARKKNIAVELIGIDANPFIVGYAKQNTKGFPEINIHQYDVLSENFQKEQYDIINCTLFCHHFDDKTLVSLLSKLRQQTSTAIIINDIHRHWFAYHSIKLLTKYFSSSDMVKNDAKLSVLRAFKKNELKNIVTKAGFDKYSIRWKWAFRYETIIHLS